MAHLPDPPLEVMSCRPTRLGQPLSPSRRVAVGGSCVRVHPGRRLAAGVVLATKRNWEDTTRPGNGWKGERRSVTLPSLSLCLFAATWCVCSARMLSRGKPVLYSEEASKWYPQVGEAMHWQKVGSADAWPGPLTNCFVASLI